jgi:hypothetical protein
VELKSQRDLSNFDENLTNQAPEMTPKSIGIYLYGKFPLIKGYTYCYDQKIAIIKEDENESCSSNSD